MRCHVFAHPSTKVLRQSSINEEEEGESEDEKKRRRKRKGNRRKRRGRKYSTELNPTPPTYSRLLVM